MDEFKGKYTQFADEEFDFESIMREFGSGSSADSRDYGSVGAVHFGLDDDDLSSYLLSSEKAETKLQAEPEPTVIASKPFKKPEELRFDVTGVSDDEPDDTPEVGFFEDVGEDSGIKDPPLREARTHAYRERRPDSFKEAVLAPIVKLLSFLGVKAEQSRISLGEFMTAEDEAPSEELPPEKAAGFYERHIKSLALRYKLAFLMSLVLICLSLGLPGKGVFANVGVKAAACTVILLGVMLCGLDIITEGLTALGRKKPDANTLIAISSLLCVLDGFIVSSVGKNAGLPYSVIPALTIAFSLLGSFLNCRSCRAAFLTLSATKKPYTVTANAAAGGKDITLRRTCTGTEGFVRRTEESGPDETAFAAMSPFLIIITFLLAIAAAVISKGFSGFMHILSGIFVFAAPAGMLIAYPLPNIISTLALRKRGSAVAGWSGLLDIGLSHHIVVTDSDLFSGDNIRIANVRIFAGSKPSRVVSLAGSLISASGSALAPSFTELMHNGNGRLMRVDSFKPHEGGGLVGIIEGTQVYCGTASFMHLMGVQLPEKYSFKDCIYISENKEICGMFIMEYSASPAVKSSLAALLRSSLHPVFALRDFNMTPKLISLQFDTATDGFDFPSFSERYAISDPDAVDLTRPAAIVSKEGLDDFVGLAEYARGAYGRIRLCVLLSVLSCVLGIGMMFVLSLTGAAKVKLALIFALIWLIPVIFIALGSKT